MKLSRTLRVCDFLEYYAVIFLRWRLCHKRLEFSLARPFVPWEGRRGVGRGLTGARPRRRRSNTATLGLEKRGAVTDKHLSLPGAVSNRGDSRGLFTISFDDRRGGLRLAEERKWVKTSGDSNINYLGRSPRACCHASTARENLTAYGS